MVTAFFGQDFRPMLDGRAKIWQDAMQWHQDNKKENPLVNIRNSNLSMKLILTKKEHHEK